MNIKYYYYISESKVNLLKAQIGTKTNLANFSAKAEVPGFGLEIGFDREKTKSEQEQLIRDLSAVMDRLQKNNDISSLSKNENINNSLLYSDESEWHHGLYSITTIESDEHVVTYIAWKAMENKIFLLLGSPSNIFGEKQVSEGTELYSPSTRSVNKLVESSLQWEFIKTIDDCGAEDPNEMLSVNVDTDKLRKLKVNIEKVSPPKLVKAQEPVLRGSALAAFCSTALERLPLSKIETVFKIFHSFPVSRSIALYDVVYVGSPLYTALG